MALFEAVTKAQLKDCILEDTIIFVVQTGQMGLAIGKGGMNVRKIEYKLKQKIKIVEWNENLLVFTENLVAPLKLKGISQDDDIVVMEPIDLKTRGMLIGRSASHLRRYEGIIQRYFKIKELKVN